MRLGSSVVGGLRRNLRLLDSPNILATLAPDLVEVLEVSGRNLGDVSAAEHADLELGSPCPVGGELGTRVDEVAEILEDDLVGADELGDVEAIALVRDQFLRRRQVDSTAMFS